MSGTESSPTPSPAVRPSRTVIALAITVLLLGGLISWRTVHDERAHAEVGQVIAAAAPLSDTRSAYVVLPTGRLDIRATGLREDVDEDGAVRSRQAPDGGGFVGLQLAPVVPVSFGSDLEPLSLAGTLDFSGKQPTTVALVADGRRYPLRKDDDGTVRGPTGTWYVAVTGHPDRLQLEVDFDGRTQRVDLRTGQRESGVFAPLYRAVASRDCGAPVVTAGATSEGRTPACRVDPVLRTPYVATLGWAAPGTVWLVAVIDVRVADGYVLRTNGRVQRYDTTRLQDVTYRIDGVTGTSQGPGGSGRGLVSFPLPTTTAQPSTLTVAAVAKLLLNDGDRTMDPTEPTVTTRWSVRL